MKNLNRILRTLTAFAVLVSTAHLASAATKTWVTLAASPATTNITAGVATNVTNVVMRVGQDTKEIGMEVTRIRTPFGTVNLLMDRWAQTTLIPLVDPTHAGLLTYDAFAWEDLAKTGDYERAEVVGEFTFCLRQNAAHALLTAVT